MSVPLHIDLRTHVGSFELAVRIDTQAPVVAVFGPSGAGKTTLLQLLAGLLRPKRGVIRVGDHLWVDTASGTFVRPEQRGIGYVFQDGRLFPHMTVRGNLQYARRAGPSGALSFGDITDCLELRPLLARRPASLSAGERQRVAFARALLSRPAVLLCDEPLAAVEHGLRQAILDTITPLLRDAAVPVLYVSHDLAELLHLTRDFVMLDQGRCVGCGDYAALLARGPEIQLADRLGLVNLLTVAVDQDASSDRLLCGRLGDQSIWMPAWEICASTTVRVGLRPEDVALARELVSGVSVQNQIPGIVLDQTEVHGLVFVRVDLGNEQRLMAKVTPRACQQLQLQRGSRVLCLFKASALHLL